MVYPLVDKSLDKGEQNSHNMGIGSGDEDTDDAPLWCEDGGDAGAKR
jgi:hypothetical protein